MKLAREGIPFVLGFLVLGLAGAAVGALAQGRTGWLAAVLAVPGLALTAFSAWFFRDPERDVPGGEDVVVSSADGRVVAVESSPEGPTIAVFLNVFDVHVNRSPIAGRVTSVAYTKGKFLAAYDERAGDRNERNEIVIEGPQGSVRVRQIAGYIARRIVCRVKVGDRLGAGQRFGLIRFGSRTDLRLPPGSIVTVKVGDRVSGGSTVVGRLPGWASSAAASAADPVAAAVGATAGTGRR